MVKRQDVRILDVVLFGPAMIWAARYLPNDTAKLLMFALGVGTIVLNYENFRSVNRGEEI